MCGGRKRERREVKRRVVVGEKERVGIKEEASNQEESKGGEKASESAFLSILRSFDERKKGSHAPFLRAFSLRFEHAV